MRASWGHRAALLLAVAALSSAQSCDYREDPPPLVWSEITVRHALGPACASPTCRWQVRVWPNGRATVLRGAGVPVIETRITARDLRAVRAAFDDPEVRRSVRTAFRCGDVGDASTELSVVERGRTYRHDIGACIHSSRAELGVMALYRVADHAIRAAPPLPEPVPE